MKSSVVYDTASDLNVAPQKDVPSAVGDVRDKEHDKLTVYGPHFRPEVPHHPVHGPIQNANHDRVAQSQEHKRDEEEAKQPGDVYISLDLDQ